MLRTVQAMVDSFSTPQEAARGDIPLRYSRVLGESRRDDLAVILLGRNEPPALYPYEVVCRRINGGWEELGGSNGDGWKAIGEGAGVVTFWGEAPPGEETVNVRFGEALMRCPVADGYFLRVI